MTRLLPPRDLFARTSKFTLFLRDEAPVVTSGGRPAQVNAERSHKAATKLFEILEPVAEMIEPAEGGRILRATLTAKRQKTPKRSLEAGSPMRPYASASFIRKISSHQQFYGVQLNGDCRGKAEDYARWLAGRKSIQASLVVFDNSVEISIPHVGYDASRPAEALL